MLTLVSSCASAANRRARLKTGVETYDPHGLICLLLDALQRKVRASKLAMDRGDIPDKCKQIGVAIDILEEGLKPGLNLQDGGDLAWNLLSVYDYCVHRLISANVRNDSTALSEVTRLIEPIHDGWKQINGPGPAYLKLV